MNSSYFSQQLRKWLAIVISFCLISISVDGRPEVSAQNHQPEFGSSGSIPDDLVFSNGYFPFEYELLKQTTTIWQDGRGVMVTERVLRNVGSASGDRAYWSFNWGPGVYSNIKAWDAQGQLQVLVDEYSTGIATTVVFRYPVQPNQTYNFFLSVTIDEFAWANNGSGYASWYTNPGGVVRQYNSGTKIKWMSGLQSIQPAPSYQSGEFLEWRYANTTSTFHDTVSISYTYNKPPLILVHGFMGLDFDNGGYSCNDGIVPYNNNEPNSTLPRDYSPALADWLTDLGYDVWIAHLETSPNHTDTLVQNAQCLKNQITEVAAQNPLPITIIAHSMGGVVSRAAIRSLDPSIKVESLYTLGSPHAGLPTDVIIATLGVIGVSYSGLSGLALPAEACKWQAGACDMSVINMASSFNKAHSNKPGVSYNFIGGDGGEGWLHKFLLTTLQGPNDGLVGQASAVGWVYPSHAFLPSSWASPSLPRQYFTDESHPAMSNPGKAYYLEQDEQGFSDSFGCIKALLIRNDPESQYCSPAASILSSEQTDVTTLADSQIVFTEFHSGRLNASANISIPLVVDSPNSTMFTLNWVGGAAPSFLLISPSLEEFNPLNLPEGVTYETGDGGPESPAYAIYTFPTTEIGTWRLGITASDMIDYQAYAVMDSPRTLGIETDKTTYSIGETASITATVTSNNIGILNAVVTGKVSRPDNTVVDVIFSSQGDGSYTGTYLIPSVPGDYSITVKASGNDNGVPFIRESSLLFSVASDNLQVNQSEYNARDDNNDGLFEYLDLNLVLSLINPGSYSVNADLYAGEQFITSAGNFFDLLAGSQAVQLSFDGATIREAGINGPYSIRNLSITSGDTGVTDQSVENVIDTSFYYFTHFGAHVCYRLTLDHVGSGANPVASPSNSDGCSADEFIPGETITLTASPDLGWNVHSWAGTGYDISKSAVNVLEMPAAPHAISVTYKLIISNTTLRSIGNYDGWILESTETSGTGGTQNNKATTFFLGDDSSNRQYRSILSFDTTLPSNAVITKVTLKLKYAGKAGTNPFSTHGNLLVDVRKNAFSGNNSLQLGDFKAAPSKSNVGSIPKTLVSNWHTKVWTSGIFNYINKSGVTQFRLRFAKDDNNDFGADYLKIYSGNAGAANRPQLIIEYYVP